MQSILRNGARSEWLPSGTTVSNHGTWNIVVIIVVMVTITVIFTFHKNQQVWHIQTFIGVSWANVAMQKLFSFELHLFLVQIVLHTP